MTLPAGLTAWLATLGNDAKVTHADLVTVPLADGSTVYRWTSAAVSITYGGNTYFCAGSSGPGVEVQPASSALLPKIDTQDVLLRGDGTYLINGKTLPMLGISGYFAGARLQVDHLMGPDLPTALGWGPIVAFFEGRIGQPEPQGGGDLLLHCSTETVTLQQSVPNRIMAPQCPYCVYDANCGLNIASFTLSGAASGSPTTTNIPTTSAALTAKAAGYFDLGMITFTSGVLSGVTADILSWNGSSFTLTLPLSRAPAAGDTFTVVPGCDDTEAKCVVLGNLANFGGFAHQPTAEAGN